MAVKSKRPKNLKDDDGIQQLGQKIREIRLDKELTQEGLAYEAGLEYSQISRIERGVINTSVSQVLAIAKALKVSPSKLFEFEVQGSKKK